MFGYLCVYARRAASGTGATSDVRWAIFSEPDAAQRKADAHSIATAYTNGAFWTQGGVDAAVEAFKNFHGI